jgi:plasmid rolling circle replication initiator protein Rep
MPDFTPDDIDIEPYEFVDACNSREIKELINSLVDNGHLPKEVVYSDGNVRKDKRGVLEIEFMEKLDEFKEKYYSLSLEDEQTMQQFFKKYL